jgi:FtsZ-interacting cell division protein YlmF
MAGVEVIVHYPTSLDDATRIIREVKGNKITMFDISSIPTDEEARRVVDYIGGAAFGMECPFERLCPSIFCIAPTGVKFDIKKRY